MSPPAFVCVLSVAEFPSRTTSPLFAMLPMTVSDPVASENFSLLTVTFCVLLLSMLPMSPPT